VLLTTKDWKLFVPLRSYPGIKGTYFHPVQQSNAVPIDYTKMQNQGTEVIQFSYELKLRFLLKTFGLHEIAQTQSIDL
jgi:hypothetical protein